MISHFYILRRTHRCAVVAVVVAVAAVVVAVLAAVAVVTAAALLTRCCYDIANSL